MAARQSGAPSPKQLIQYQGELFMVYWMIAGIIAASDQRGKDAP